MRVYRSGATASSSSLATMAERKGEGGVRVRRGCSPIYRRSRRGRALLGTRCIAWGRSNWSGCLGTRRRRGGGSAAGTGERRGCVAPGQMVLGRWCVLVSPARVARGETGAVWHEPRAVSHRRRSAGGVAAVQVDLRACHVWGRPSGALGVKLGAGLSETGGVYRDMGGVRRSPGEREQGEGER